MAITNTLRARIEMLGGKEIVAEFEKIKGSSKSAFNTIEREAKEATRDVKALERELAKLELLAKAIRADIKVRKGGSLTQEQQQALALAKQIDSQAAGIRNQINAANDTLRQGGGDALRTLAGAADKDILKVAESTDALDQAVQNLRKNGGLGGIISPDRIDALDQSSKSIRSEGGLYQQGLADRVSSADAADIAKEAHRKAAEQKDQERFEKRQEAIRQANAKKSEDDEIRETERRKRRLEDQANYLAQIDERDAKRKLSHEEQFQRIKDEGVRREEEASRRREELEARRVRQEAIREAAREKQAEDKRRRDEAYANRPLKQKVDEAVAAEIERRDFEKLKAAALGKLRPDLVKTVDDFDKDGKRLTGISGAFNRAGKIVTSTASDIAKGLRGSIGDVGKFVQALSGLSSAIGNAALRTGIAGLLGALAGGLAALGGAAVLAGIAAIAGLAGWDATKIANNAKQIGVSLKEFSSLRYAAQLGGVDFDTVTQSLTGLNGKMTETLKKDEKTGKFGDGTLWQGNGRLAGLKIDAVTPDRTKLRDTAEVLKDVADIYNRFQDQTLKNAFVDEVLGSDGRALIPLLEKGRAGIEAWQKEAEKVGVVIDEKVVKDFQILNEEVFKIWNVIRGIGYAIAREVLPVVKPVMDAINEWLIGNRDNIAKGVLAAWNYLIRTVKDFYSLFKAGDNATVVQQWTKQLYDGVMQVYSAFMFLWNGIAAGYRLAEPALTKISDYFGRSGPLEIAILGVSAWILGFFGVFTSGTKVALAALNVLRGAFTLLLTPLSGLLSLVLGIVGWPVALVAGIGIVAAYWDDIGALFTKAWGKFKETFPQTAKYLEDTFGPALKTAQDFVGKMVESFESRFPRLAKLFGEVRDSIKSAWEWIGNLDWSGMFKGLTDASLGALDWLARLLDKISPLLSWVGKAISEIVSAAAPYVGAAVGAVGNVAGQVVQANADAILGGADVLGGWAQQKLTNMEGFSPSPIPANGWSNIPTPSPSPASSGGGATPIVISVNDGPTVYATTTQPDAAAALAARARAKVTAR